MAFMVEHTSGVVSTFCSSSRAAAAATALTAVAADACWMCLQEDTAYLAISLCAVVSRVRMSKDYLMYLHVLIMCRAKHHGAVF
jgi:hypothetical protein